MLTSVLERTGKSQDFWAGKFDLDRSHLNKLLRGKRAVGPKAAGRLIAELPQEYHQHLIAAHLLDELLAVTANMGSAGKSISQSKPSEGSPAVAKDTTKSMEKAVLAKLFGPGGPSLQRTLELANPSIGLALERYLKDLIKQEKG